MGEDSGNRTAGRKFAAFAALLLSSAYLLNPGLGVFELIPDNFPVVGNLDEAAATALLIYCVRYLWGDDQSIPPPDVRSDG